MQISSVFVSSCFYCRLEQDFFSRVSRGESGVPPDARSRSKQRCLSLWAINRGRDGGRLEKDRCHGGRSRSHLSSCRGLDTTYAKGWLIIVGANRTSPVPGNGMRRRHARRRILPRFGALRGDNTPSPALRGLRMITRSIKSSYNRS